MNLSLHTYIPYVIGPLLFAGACTNTKQEATASEMTGKEQKTISILHTNDMHGTYMPFLTTTDNATAQTGDAGRDTLITFDKAARIGGFAYLSWPVL